MTKHRLKVALLVLGSIGLAGAIAVVVIIAPAGRIGSGAVEEWVGKQVQAIAAGYLNPTLVFSKFDYRYPSTAVITDCRLTADDPARPGETIDILAVQRITLELGEVPKIGRPIVIERLSLDGPELRLIAAGPGDSGFIGFADLLKRDPGGAPDGTEPIKFSEVFRIRLIRIARGSITYDPRDPDRPPMELDRITSELTAEPADTSRHLIELRMHREPVLELDAKGRINLDAGAFDLNDLKLNAQLGHEHDRYLPPPLQRWLREHDVTGRLNVEAEGTIPFADWRGSNLTARLLVEDAGVSFGRYKLPVNRLLTRARARGGQLVIEHFDLDMLGGRIRATGTVGLNEPADGRFDLEARDLQVEQLWRAGAGDADAPPALAGLLSADVRFSAPLMRAATESAGGGEVHLREGRIVELPIVSSLAEVAAKIVDGVTLKKGSAGRGDEGDVVFEFSGDHVHLSSIRLKGPVLGVRGEGRIYFDSRLDLRLNAGPLEKIENELGIVGEVLGAVTGKIAKYRVQGTLAEPKIGIELLAVGGDEPAAAQRTSNASSGPDSD